MTAESKYSLISIATLLGAFFLNGLAFVAPLACWLAWRSDPPLSAYALHRANACLTLLAGILLSSLIGYFIAFAGIFLGSIISLVWFIFCIIDVIKSIQGNEYTYPFTFHFIK